MKISLPIIGSISLGKDAEETVAFDSPTPPIIDKSYDILGSLLPFRASNLSSERTISNRILKANKEWVYRNNDVIAQEVASIEFELFSVDLKNGEVEFTLVEDHQLLDSLDKFNSRTTKSDGIYMTQSHKKLTGDAFWLLVKNGTVVESIFILPPDKVELVLADPTDATADLIKSYLYVDTIDGKRIQKEYTPEEIIHFKKPNPDNPFRGLGAVEAMADTIDTDTITNEVQRNFFEKGAIGNFVLTTDSNITTEQIKRMKAELQASYGGFKNAFKAMIFGGGLKPVDIGFSNKDMDFLNLLTWYRDKIMIGFGNTKASIGIIDDVNRASFEGSLAGWLRSTVKPDMDSIVQTINEFMVPLYGENLILGFKDPVPQNKVEDTKQAVDLKDAGIIQINEAREMVGLAPIDGGDIFQGETTPVADANAEDNNNDQANSAKAIRIQKNKIPASLRHIDIQPILRDRGILLQKKINKQIKADVTPLIRRMVTNKKAPKIVKKEVNDGQITEEAANEYYEKQIALVEAFENQFHDKVQQLLDKVKSEALDNFEHEIKTVKGLQRFMKKKELFDEDAMKVQAQVDLTPILMQELILAGQEAYRLIGVEDTYIPYKVQDSVRQVVDKFADSMLTTDKDKLAQIIAAGVDAGDSITDIRDAITNEFGDYTKVQAERITRTEVLRVSSMAAEDAFIQSGVVEAKQWLVAPGADSRCLPYAGKIVKLNKDFYDPDDSGFQNGNPPIHVNCRCQLIPIVTGTTGYATNNEPLNQEMARYVSELEKQLDKRTTAAKKLMEERSDDAVYIKSLEKHLGIDNE